MAKEIRGIIPALITPFTVDERVDETAFRKVVNAMIDHGVHGLFPVGTGGEFSTLTSEEKKRLMEVTVEETAGRVFVMPNVGAITTAESVALARHAEAVGCDAVSAVTPFFLKPTQEELFEHYRAICAATTLPVLAYNIPERTGGVALSVGTVSRLAREVKNFAGIKDSTGDLTNSAEFVQACPPGFRVFMGRDTLIFGALLYGCAGAVAATANVAPALAVGIYDAVTAGDLAKALDLQTKLAPVRRLFTIGSHPAGIKEAMVQLGMISCGRCRRPTSDLTPAQTNEVTKVLRDAGLLGKPLPENSLTGEIPVTA